MSYVKIFGIAIVFGFVAAALGNLTGRFIPLSENDTRDSSSAALEKKSPTQQRPLATESPSTGYPQGSASAASTEQLRQSALDELLAPDLPRAYAKPQLVGPDSEIGLTDESFRLPTLYTENQVWVELGGFNNGHLGSSLYLAEYVPPDPAKPGNGNKGAWQTVAGFTLGLDLSCLDPGVKFDLIAAELNLINSDAIEVSWDRVIQPCDLETGEVIVGVPPTVRDEVRANLARSDDGNFYVVQVTGDYPEWNIGLMGLFLVNGEMPEDYLASLAIVRELTQQADLLASAKEESESGIVDPTTERNEGSFSEASNSPASTEPSGNTAEVRSPDDVAPIEQLSVPEERSDPRDEAKRVLANYFSSEWIERPFIVPWQPACSKVEYIPYKDINLFRYFGIGTGSLEVGRRSWNVMSCQGGGLHPEKWSSI
jgi:hypothetical protein